MKKSEINLLATFAKHCERVLTRSRPSSTDSRTYNAYRMARYKELEKVKRIINDLQHVHEEDNTNAG